MKLLTIAKTHLIAGGDLDGVSCECWKVIGLMGFSAFYGDISEEYALKQVDLFCTPAEQDQAETLAKDYYK